MRSLKEGRSLVPSFLAVLGIAGILLFAGCGDGESSSKSGETQQVRLVGDRFKPEGKWCPSTDLCFTEFQWDVYSKIATGSGNAELCSPDYGTCKYFRNVAVVASQPKSVCGADRFTALEVLGDRMLVDRRASCQRYKLSDDLLWLANKYEEYSGSCLGPEAEFPVEGSSVGFFNVYAVDAECSLALSVARGYVEAFVSEGCGDDLSDGSCPVMVESLPCAIDEDAFEYVNPKDPYSANTLVGCWTARTGVAFALAFRDY
jgi:hypothetical protein